jgi:hypothetical protein
MMREKAHISAVRNPDGIRDIYWVFADGEIVFACYVRSQAEDFVFGWNRCLEFMRRENAGR